MRRALLLGITVLVFTGWAPGGRATAADSATTCMAVSGALADRCLQQYTLAVEKCRQRPRSACETALRAEGGPLDALLAAPESAIRSSCPADAAETLGYTSEDDVVLRVSDACSDFGEDQLDIDYTSDLASLSGRTLLCQRFIARRLDQLRAITARAFGHDCFLRGFAGGTCDRAQRDRRVERARARVRRDLLDHCAAEIEILGLSGLDPGASPEQQVDAILDRVVDHARHFAQRVYPPNDLGPTAEFGPYPIGVRTLNLADPSRLAVGGEGPRPVTVEVYYPSTAEAVAGVPRDVVQVLGFPVVATPAFRDVAIAPGPFPLVLFSHGNNGIRFQSFFFAGHLASHGFVVVAPDHHGNTFVDTLNGIVDPNVATNRPLDISFLIDQFLDFSATPGNFFSGEIDPQRIGMSGHSFGGYTALAVAGGAFSLGTFTDARIKATLPQAPVDLFPDEFFSSITIPTLLVGGSIDETTPFGPNQQRPFDLLPSGAAVVALAEVIDAGHFTFSDFCEVPRNLLSFLGGFDEACEPRHIAWRYAHDIVNYLSLNFFDGVLNGNADALDRLSVESVAPIEDLIYERK